MINQTSENNKRIAKNTLFMYLRMFMTMGMGLYTSRVVLNSLGVEDYGLYNVIGGIIAMFGFINGAMTNTTSRYISYYLGNNKSMLSKVFSMTFFIHAIIALIIITLGETIGLWYVNNKLVIPDGRYDAAFWLYQFSIAASVVNILYIPFNASIIAHERMKAFAYIAIVDACLKLGIALLINYAPLDKLIFYGLLMFIVTFIDISCYVYYCFKHFEETTIKVFFDKIMFKEMMGFTGWSMFGNFAFLFYSYGINLILNLFFGPAVNAARGIAVQIENVVRQFASNVQVAMNPQIVKSYAEDNLSRTHMLIFASSKYCFFLLFLLSLPIMVEADNILHIWLGLIPEHTVNFVRITLLVCLLDTLATPLFTGNLATGKIRTYQTAISVVSYTMMPITFFAVKYSFVPEVAFICLLLSKGVEHIARIIVSKKKLHISLRQYFVHVVMPVVFVFTLSMILSFTLKYFMDEDLVSSILLILISVATVISFVYMLGLSKEERIFVNGKIQQIRVKLFK